MPKLPKFCLHRPTGQAYVRVRGQKARYLGKYDSPQAQEAYGRLIAELAAAPNGPASPAPVGTDITVVELCAAYLDFAQQYYVRNGKPSNRFDHVKLMVGKLRDLYGHTPAADFGPLKFKAIRQQVVDQGCSRPYVNSMLAILPRIFRWGAAEELVPASVYTALKTVEGLRRGHTTAREPKPIMPVPDAVVDATLPWLPPIVADMVRLERLTGCRPGEVCQLRPMDLDRSGDVWAYRPASHKTEHHGRERVIMVGPKAQAVLLPYLLRAADACCFSPAESEEKRHVEQRARRRTRVQPSQQHRRKSHRRRAPRTRYASNSYTHAIHRAIAKANRAGVAITTWSPNQLRHSAGTEIRRLYGLEAAQVVLGHAKANTTEVYAERDYGLAAEVARKIG